MSTRVTRSASKPKITEDSTEQSTNARPKKQRKAQSTGASKKSDAGRHDEAVNETSPASKSDAKFQAFSIDIGDKSIACERRGSGEDKLIFTHGAGGGLNTPATIEFAEGFAQHACVVSFEGTMSLPSRVKSFTAVIDEIKCQAIGGRSMGSRAAIMARSDQVLVLVSYPLVAKTIRDQLLLDLPEVDVLFVIGTNDKMCPIDELSKVREKMKATSWLLQVEGLILLTSTAVKLIRSGADHGMNMKPKSATTPVRHATGSEAAKWLEQRPESFEGTLKWADDQPVVQWH